MPGSILLLEGRAIPSTVKLNRSPVDLKAEGIRMCEDKDFERNHYFFGKLLTAQDFVDEQNYFVEKTRRHNRYLHGWGVVSGLRVEVQEGETSNGETRVVISPGMAIDCRGNEIYVCTAQEARIPRNKNRVYLTIEYREELVEPIPKLNSEGTGDPSNMEANRIREGFCIQIASADPTTDHGGIGPGTAGCGNQHPFSLAYLVKENHQWRVILLGRCCQQY
jgi:hypothetical protein